MNVERKDTYYVPNLGQTVDAGEFAGARDVEIMALKKQAGKNNNAFIMGMRSLDEPVSLGNFDGYLQKKAKDMGLPGTGSSAWEATKGFVEGAVKAPVRWTGYAATNSLPLIAKTATSLYAFSGAAGDAESADKFIREANKGIEAWTKEIQRITGIDDAGAVESTVGNALGSVWGSVAIGGTFGNATVAPAFGVSAFQDTYTKQREKGVGIDEAATRGAWHGIGEWQLERLQFNRIFGSLAKKSKPIAIIKDLLENSVQEGLQQANEQAANWNIDNRNLTEKLQEIGASMVGGAIASLGGSVGGNYLNRKTIDEVGELMKKTGHNDAEIQQVKENLGKLVDSDELSQAATQVAKDELTTIALTYKEQAKAASEALVKELDDTIARNELVDIGGELSGDKTEGMPPEYQLGELRVDTKENPHLGMVLYQAEQSGQPIQTLGQVFEWTKGKIDFEEAKRLNTGLNSVYSKTYEQLKGFGQSEKLADSNARIRSAMAFSIAKNFGVDVEQADKMLGGIVKSTQEEFEKNNIESDKALPQFAGQKAQTAAQDRLEAAKKMSESGEDIEKIRKETGWHKAPDGSWRFEISDKDAKINKDATKLKETTLGNLLRHKKLYEAYPELEKLPVYKNGRMHANGAFVQRKNSWTGEVLKEYIEYKSAKDLEDLRKTVLHEVKHAIEHFEGWYSANGLSNRADQELIVGAQSLAGDIHRMVPDLKIKYIKDIFDEENIKRIEQYEKENPKDKKQLEEALEKVAYNLLHGRRDSEYNHSENEVSARNVEYRSKMSEKELEKTPIQNTADVNYVIINYSKIPYKAVKIPGAEIQISTNQFRGPSGRDMPQDAFYYNAKAVMDRLQGQKIKNDSIGAEIEIRTSSVKKFNSFLADPKKQAVVEAIPELLRIAKFEKEKSYAQSKEPNIKAYWKADVPVGIDNGLFNAHITVRQDNQGNYFYDLKIENGSQRAAPATNPGDTTPISSSDDTFIIAQNGLEVKREPDRKLGAYMNNTVYLFENANESTFIHEMSHAYTDVIETLARSGNKQAQKDLLIIRKWLSKGENEAFTQSDYERFARGFETYLREGNAPNEYLGGNDGVFARFKNWLLDIYGGIKSLTVKNEEGNDEPVKINKQIKEFYDEMLGGADIDKMFDNAKKNGQAISVITGKMKELANAQQKLAEERAKIVREMANQVKPDTTWANVKDWGNDLLESAKELPVWALKSTSERLAKIDKKLGVLVQKVEQSQGLRLKKWSDQIKPFYEAFNDLTADDKAKVQFYLLNQQWGAVAELVGQENTDAVHDMLEGIYKELVASGVEVGYRESYFPRAVLDYDGLLQEMGLTYPSLRKEMESAIGKDATPQEQAEWLDKHIMGFKGTVSTNGNRNTKERKLDLITDRMAKYYKPSMETLVDYMHGMAKLLSMREAFGKDIEYKEGNKESAEDSIGKIINNLFGDNKLSKKEVDEVRQVLGALYLPNGIGNKFIQAMRQYGYATKLSYSTTIRQFADIGMMMKVNGVLNTLDALFHPDKRLSLEELGIDPLGEEFQTSKKDIGGGIASLSTKLKGINWADAVMKNAYIRGNYKSLQKLAETPEKFHAKYDALFGDETDTIIKDLLDDKISEPVKVLLFHEISKIQPISRSAMPEAYLNNPNGRIFYMFKTFSLHRAEYMVSELAEDFRTGNLKKAGKDIMADVAVIGWEGLVELLIAFLKYGWQALAGKAVFETFAGSGLSVFGLNKHQALQISRGQIGDFFQEMFGVGTPVDDIAYMIRHYDDEDKLLRAFLPDMIVEPLLVGPKKLNKKAVK